MSARLLINVWHDIADPWSRIGLSRLLRGIDLARAQRNLLRAERDFRAGRDFASAGHDGARGSTSGTALSEVVVDVHSFLSPGDPLPEASAEVIAAIAVSEEAPIAKEGPRRLPTKPLRRLTHRIVHTVRENVKSLTNGVRHVLEAVIRLNDWFLGVDKVPGSGAPASSFTQATVQTDSELRLQKSVQPGSLIHSEDAPPRGRDQAHQGALDAGQTPLEENTIEPSPGTIGRIAGLATSDLLTLEGRLETGEWEAAVDRDAADAKRLWTHGLPLIVVGARAMLVGVQSPEVFAEAILEATAMLSDSEHPPQARRFSL